MQLGFKLGLLYSTQKDIKKIKTLDGYDYSIITPVVTCKPGVYDEMLQFLTQPAWLI